mmetsp:Transcript_108599/g.231960  ORF Transcript_108599/g.231960 Transcript_108599/m.231960 type:complete len:166 (+) Transcript_108599:85-582(+)
MAGAVFENAKTGRSSCSMTGEAISQGSPRIGFEIWRVGRRCMTYQTPRAFFSRLVVSVAQDSRSKCKFSQAQIQAGDLCVTFTSGGAKGETPTLQLCSLAAASSFLREAAQGSGIALRAEAVTGIRTLTSEQQRLARDLLTGAGSKARLRKRPAASAPAPKRRRT